MGLHWVYLIVAIAFAVFAANLLIKGGTSLGHRLGVPQVVIGAVVVGFGSSMPEFSVSITAVTQGTGDLAIGNVLGSNVFNITFILGVIAIIRPVPVGRDTRLKDVPLHFMATLVLAVSGNQLYLDHINYHELMPSHGIIFLCFFSIYIYYTILEVAAESPAKTPLHRSHHRAVSYPEIANTLQMVLYILIGLAGLAIGGDAIVTQATTLAEAMGMSDDTIGLLIVGPGTSVPELIACLMAVYKRNTDMVLGNILGSNIFNLFFILGVSAIISPLPLDLELNQVLVLYGTVSLLVWITLLIRKKKEIDRVVGLALLTSFAAYLFMGI